MKHLRTPFVKFFIENMKNNFDFFLRQRLTLSKKNYSEPNEAKENLFSDKELIERESQLYEKFGLEYIKSNSTRQNYLENLYTIDILEGYLGIEPKVNLKVLDIGCKNWFYAKGEYFFFEKYCNYLQLDGLEIDTNRLYSNLYTRGEVAKFYIKDLENVNYIGKDFLKHEEKYDYITWILPFIVEEPLLKWGLPLKYFKPEKMLQHAYDLLNEGGSLFIVNQGEVEYKVQRELCEILNIYYIALGEIKSKFLDYEIPRYGILIKK